MKSLSEIHICFILLLFIIGCLVRLYAIDHFSLMFLFCFVSPLISILYLQVKFRFHFPPICVGVSPWIGKKNKKNCYFKKSLPFFFFSFSSSRYGQRETKSKRTKLKLVGDIVGWTDLRRWSTNQSASTLEKIFKKRESEREREKN